MNGGGEEEIFKLGDIGDFQDLGDVLPMGTAALTAMNFGLIASRFFGVGGISANAFHDTFGLEGILAKGGWILVLFHLARWCYTRFYVQGAGRAWSPFVFVCILLAIQIVHDLLFYYGIIKNTPLGKNDMIDGLRKYASENGSRVFTEHAILLILASVLAMVFKESSSLFIFVVAAVGIVVLPFLLTTLGPKPPPPPPPPSTKEGGAANRGGNGAFDMPQWNGPRF
jgi:hypothetical protein